jgi:hypothetical protein
MAYFTQTHKCGQTTDRVTRKFLPPCLAAREVSACVNDFSLSIAQGLGPTLDGLGQLPGRSDGWGIPVGTASSGVFRGRPLTSYIPREPRILPVNIDWLSLPLSKEL